MKTFARIEAGIVAEIFRGDELPDFHTSLTWVEVVGDVAEGWPFDGANVVPPPVPSFQSQRAAKIAALEARRWIVETSGIVVDGAEIRTDRESQSKISGALQLVERNPTAVIDWKGANGWVQIQKPEVEMIADLVAAHVQACFTRERQLHDLIMAAEDIAALDAIDIDAGWPS